MKNYSALFSILFSIVFTILLSCSPANISGSEVTNERFISLTGHVLSKNGAGVPGIEASLSGLGFSDTTDQNGFYTISISEDSLISLNISLEALTDTLFVKQNNSIVNSFEITRFIDTLPDTYLIQRNVYGKLLPSSTQIDSIEAVITLKGSATDTVTIALWLNKATQDFSGFVYMLPADQSTIFSVYVNTYDIQRRFTGRSTTIEFPGNAGDIKIPDFTPNNALPSASITSIDTAKIVKKISFSANYRDFFGGSIDHFYWNFGDNTNDTGTIVEHSYSKAGTYDIVLTVVDSDSNSILTSKKITITNETPLITMSSEKNAYAPASPVSISLTVEDDGDTYTVELKHGNSQFNAVTADNISFTAPDTVAAQYPVTVRVTDEDSNSVEDTLLIGIGVFHKILYDNAYGEDVIATSDNGFLITGQKDSAFVVIKTDAMGEIIWTKSFGNNGVGYSCLETSDGHYIVAGEDTSIRPMKKDVCIVKLDKDGNTLWNKSYGDRGDDYVKDMIESEDGNYMLVGSTGSFLSNGDKNIYILKVSTSGDTIWTQSIHLNIGDAIWPQSMKEYAVAIDATVDGGYVIVGNSYPPDVSQDYSKSFLLKVDKDGSQEWSKFIDHRDFNFTDIMGYNYSSIKDVITTANGDFLITGGVSNSLYKDMILLKTDAQGTTLWADWQYPFAWGNDIIETETNEFFLCGGYGGLLKFDNSGTIDYSKMIRYSHSSPREYPDRGRAFCQSGNGFAFTGDYLSLYGLAKYYDQSSKLYLIKTDSLGETVSLED